MIKLDIFKEIFLDNLILNTPILYEKMIYLEEKILLN